MPYTDRQRIMDYGITFGTDHGARVLADICQRSHVLESTLHTEAHVFAFREGERNVALEILRYLQLKPDDIRPLTKKIQEVFE